MSTPPLKAIKIWAHLTGVPLDLRYDEGLSLVAGLVGEPPVVEFEREIGEVVEVLVHYPWVPPTCSHCHELGHIVRNCLSYSPPPAPETVSNPLAFEPDPTIPVPQSSSSHLPALVKALTDPEIPQSTSNDTAKVTFSSPDPPPRPSLKRSRSSPTLSPPSSSKAIPFSDKQNPFLPLTDNLFDPNIPLPSHKSSDPTFKQKPFSLVSIGHPPPEDPPNPSQ